ncbi:MAG: MotA/TolQ/ExbB proton channel family protein [Cyclobacteriaceae bacterium]
MFELFVMGGPLFMGIISIVFVAALIVAVRAILGIFGNGDPAKISGQLTLVRSIGLLALVFGVLGQFIGLFGAFQALEQMQGGVSPAILAGGLKVSSITTIYGLICYAITLLLSLILGNLVKS